MRIFGYLVIGFLIVWLFAPAPVAMADTAPVVATDVTLTQYSASALSDRANQAALPQSP
jgi:hypothetical protein